MGYFRFVVAAALMLGCATTPELVKTDERVYLASAETTRSENAVTACARSRTEAGFRIARIENTAYGRGLVSDYLSFRTYRAGDQTVLMVSARSYVFPESGRGEANTNTVAIPVTDEAKQRATQIVNECAESPS
jgi:hypothetical protein